MTLAQGQGLTLNNKFMRQVNQTLNYLNKWEELTFDFNNKDLTVKKHKVFDEETEQDYSKWDFKSPKDEEVYNTLTDEEQDQLKERMASDFKNETFNWITKLCSKLEEIDPKYSSSDFYANLDDWFKSYFG